MIFTPLPLLVDARHMGRTLKHALLQKSFAAKIRACSDQVWQGFGGQSVSQGSARETEPVGDSLSLFLFISLPYLYVYGVFMVYMYSSVCVQYVYVCVYI